MLPDGGSFFRILVVHIRHGQLPPHQDAYWAMRHAAGFVAFAERGWLSEALALLTGRECRLGPIVRSSDAPHEGSGLVCGAAMLHTILSGRRVAKVWRAGPPHKTHTGIPAGVWSNIAPHRPRIPVWARRVEHWRSTHEVASDCVARFMMVKHGFVPWFGLGGCHGDDRSRMHGCREVTYGDVNLIGPV